MTLNPWEDNRMLLSVISDATAGNTIYPPGGRWGPRLQPNLQFFTVHTGHVTIHIDEQSYFVPAGHAVLLHPGCREDFYFAENMETWHHWIHIEMADDMLGQTWNQIGSKLELLPRMIPLSDAMNHLTDVLQTLTHSNMIDSQRDLRCTLAVAAIQLYQTESQNERLEAGKHSSVIRAKSEIRKRFEESLNLDQIADLSGVSNEYLIRLFRQYEGVTPMRYLWMVRVEHVLEMLRSTGLSLGEIADRTGFKSVYHLSRMIKKFSGQTPTDIRQGSWSGPAKVPALMDKLDGM
ncbi:helix-turn-helix domain-containing protein [Cohnella sp.]|uniref:helix-turn-helix domain-containing protein n=1 Tax=Cohnella sp. TaxID=1883426 RepID=UPI0035628238